MRRSAPSQNLLATPIGQIAIFLLLVVGGFGGPLLAGFRLGDARHFLPLALVLLGLIVAFWLTWTTLGLVLTFQMLRERVWVLPMVSRRYQPDGAGLDFPHDLLGLRLRWFPGLSLRATGFEVAMTNAADGRPLILWRLPKRWMPTLRESVRDAFGDRLELREVPEDLLPSEGRGEKTRMILRPAKKSEWPLRELSEQIDAKGRVARVLDEVDVAAGERLWVHVNYLPVAPRGWLPAVRAMFKDAHRQTRRDPLVFTGGREARFDPEERAFRSFEQKALGSKIKDQDPLFRLQILAWGQGADARRRRGRVRDVRSAFDKWAGPNFFASPLLPRWLPGLRGMFDWMVRTGYNASDKLVAAWEALHFLLPWYGDLAPSDVIRQSPTEELPPPSDTVAETEEAEQPVGRIICLHDGRPVIQSPERATKHTYEIGPIGSGKTSHLINMGLSDLTASRGVCPWTDPKDGEGTNGMLARIPKKWWDRTVLIDPMRTDYAVGINFLECDTPERRDIVVDQLLAVFEAVFPDVWRQRQAEVMQAGLTTLLHNEDATLCDLPRLFIDERARQRWTRNLEGVENADIRAFWERYAAMSENQQGAYVGTLLSRLQSLLLRPRVKMILGQRKSTVDLADILDNGGIVIANLPLELAGTSKLLGSLLFLRTWQAVQGRQRVPEAGRKHSSAYLDEGYRFMHLGESVAEAVDMARSLRWSLAFAHQYRGQLTDARLSAAIDADMRTKNVIGRPSAEDAKVMAREMAPLEAGDLRSLKPRQVAVALPDQPPFVGETADLPPLLQPPKELADHALRKWGRPIADIEKDWGEGLDDVDSSEFDKYA